MSSRTMTDVTWRICLILSIWILGSVELAPTPRRGPTDECTSVDEDEAKVSILGFFSLKNLTKSFLKG